MKPTIALLAVQCGRSSGGSSGLPTAPTNHAALLT
jgi:hypothetical protein